MLEFLIFSAFIFFLIYDIVWLAKPKDVNNKKDLQFYYESILELQADVSSLKKQAF